MLASFHERFKFNSNIIISLSYVFPNNIENSSFNDLKPAIDFYKEDLETHNTNVDFYMVLLENEFELWQKKMVQCGTKNGFKKPFRRSIKKC